MWVPSRRLCVSIVRQNDEAGRCEVESVVVVFAFATCDATNCSFVFGMWACGIDSRFTKRRKGRLGTRQVPCRVVSCRIKVACLRNSDENVASERGDANERTARINERNLHIKDSANSNSQKNATKLLLSIVPQSRHHVSRPDSLQLPSCRGVTCCASKPGASSPRPDAALPW